jgi:FixJ family two-component response regulator
MSIIHTEPPLEKVEVPMKDAEFLDLIEHLRQMHVKAHELAAQQLELIKQLETAFKKARELHQKVLAGQNDVGGEA